MTSVTLFHQSFSDNIGQTVNVKLIKQHEDHLALDPESFVYQTGTSFNQTIVVTGLKAGSVEITSSSEPSDSWM